MASLVIETMGLSCRHGQVLAVSELDLAVQKGAVYGFLGPNGAGKTSTIRMLLGLKAPSAGELRLLGRDMAKEPTSLLEKVGSLVEHPSLYPHLTAAENLRITCRMRRLGPDAARKALEMVGLAASADHLVRTFSLGMKQRLGLALAWLGEPELLILDEPTNGLDPAGMRDIRDLLRRLPETKGTTVFVSSHLLAEVEQVASHVGVLHRGKLRFQGTLEALRHSCRRTLCIGTSDALRGREVLLGAGYEVALMGDGRLESPLASEIQAAHMNQLLVAAGLGVHHLAESGSTLERLFLELTEAA